MNPLAISAANLDTLENNMIVLNNSINAVTNDILNINGKMTSVNEEVNGLKNNVHSLEKEIRDFMAEIRGTTIVSNAQNDILLKESELNKKYGNYDIIRRQLNGLLDSININLVRKSTLKIETEKVLFNAPNYYLSYALIAISSWFNNDKEKANKALNEALKLNPSKTSLLMCFVHLRLNRNQTAVKWMKKYLETQNPYRLDNEFIVAVDAITSSEGNTQINQMVYEYLQAFTQKLALDTEIVNNVTRRWENFFASKKQSINLNDYPNLVKFTNNFDNIKNSLENAKSYYDAYYAFNNMLDKVKDVKETDMKKILNNMVYSYEEKELELKKDILRDKLIIKNNGNTKAAEENFKDSNLAYDSHTDLYNLMTNILLEREDVSLNSKKLATAILKNIIQNALSSSLKSGDEVSGITTINIGSWTGSTQTGANENELKESLKNHLAKPYENKMAECSFLNIKIILTIIGAFIGLIVAAGVNFILGLAIIIVCLILLFVFANNIIKQREYIEKKFMDALNNNYFVLENVLAELVDSRFTVKRAKENYDYIINYLNNFDDKNYIK